jgi:hypothetical protein
MCIADAPLRAAGRAADARGTAIWGETAAIVGFVVCRRTARAVGGVTCEDEGVWILPKTTSHPNFEKGKKSAPSRWDRENGFEMQTRLPG